VATVLRSRVDAKASAFAGNRAAMLTALEEIGHLQAQVVGGGGSTDPGKNARSVTRHRGRGKMLPRERIEYLLDPISPFLELAPLAGWGTEDPLGAGLVTGIGFVEGTECLLSASDPTVKGGSQGPTSVKKGLRAMDIARQNRLPMINLTESGGADLPKQSEIFVPGGASFKNLTQLSAAGIPTITLVFGSSTAGGAYVPGMSDYVVLQREAARVYLGGPPLVKMAIDEDADEEDLGGAEMHARVSGLADYLAEDEADALRIGRQIVGHLRWRKNGSGPDRVPRPPVFDPEELLGIASSDVRVPFEAREVLARVLDASEFEEFKPLYGSTLVTGWGHIGGFPVGVLANNGILFSEESQKGAQFIQLCNRMDVPILFFQNITGFMVGTKYEQGGIIKDGAKLINAVSNSGVPHITVMMGASYGAGNYGMSGRAYDPRFVFSWPNHRIAVMGPKQLAGVLTIVARQKTEAAGGSFDEAAFAPIRDAFEAQVESESTSLFATGRVWDDGIIDPRDTRTVLTLALSAVHSAEVKGTSDFGVWRM
jgi:acyl-CoA carboxylase subunit beta